MSFLDAPAFSLSDEKAHELLDILVLAYPTELRIRGVLDEAGIPQDRIAFQGGSWDIWLDVLKNTARSRTIKTLVHTVLADPTISNYHQRLRRATDVASAAALPKDQAVAQDVANALAGIGRPRSPVTVGLELGDGQLAGLGMPRTACHLTITLTADQTAMAVELARHALADSGSIADVVNAGTRIWDILVDAEPRLVALVGRITGAGLAQPVAWCGHTELLGQLRDALLLAHAGGEDADGFLSVGYGGHYLMPVEGTRDARSMRQSARSGQPSVKTADLRTCSPEQHQGRLRDAVAGDIVLGVDAPGEDDGSTEAAGPVLTALGDAVRAEPAAPTRAIFAFGAAPGASVMSQLLDSVPCASVGDPGLAEPALLAVLERALREHAERVSLPCIAAAVRAAWVRWAAGQQDVGSCLRALTWSTWSWVGLPLYANRSGEIERAVYPHLMDLRTVASGDWYFNRHKDIKDVYQADTLARPGRRNPDRFHLYLSGAGGTGKSCFLRYVHDQLAGQRGSLAVWYRVDAPGSSWENIADRIREETVRAVRDKYGTDAASEIAKAGGGLGAFLQNAAESLAAREQRFDEITVFIDQLERTFESGDEPDPSRLDIISHHLIELLKDVGVGNGVRVLVASRKQYLPDFLGSYRSARDSGLEFNVLQGISDASERVQFARRVLDWCRGEQLVAPDVLLREDAAHSLAEHTKGNPLNMMLALIQLLSQNLSGPVSQNDVERYLPWDRLFALDLQAAARDDLDWNFLLAMAHARTEIVSFEEVWWRLRMVDPRLTSRVDALGARGVLERLWLLGLLGRTIYARPYNAEPERFVEFFHANLRDYLLSEVMAHGGADLGLGGRRGGMPPAWRALDRLAVYARDWLQTQQLLPADDVRALLDHGDEVTAKYSTFDRPTAAPPFYLMFSHDRPAARETLSTAAQECYAYSALVHDDQGRKTFQALFPDIDDRVRRCGYWLSRCPAEARAAIVRYLVSLEAASARKLLCWLVLDATTPPREEMAAAVAAILAEPLYAAMWRDDVLAEVLGVAMRRADGDAGNLSPDVVSFLAAACDRDPDALVSAVSFAVAQLSRSADADDQRYAAALAAQPTADRWLAAVDGDGFRGAVALLRREDTEDDGSPVKLVVGAALRAAIDAGRAAAWSAELGRLLGVPAPGIALAGGEVSDDIEAELRIRGIRVARDVFRPGQVWVPRRRWDATGRPLPPEATQSFDAVAEEGIWLPLGTLTAAGYDSTARDFDEAMVRWLEFHCRRSFPQLVDELMPAFVREVLRTPGGRARLEGIQRARLRLVLTDLVEEGIRFGARRDAMLEELAQLEPRIQPELLSQRLREYLQAEVCASVTDESGQVTTVLLDQPLEEALANRVTRIGVRLVLPLEARQANALASAIQRHMTRLAEAGRPSPVLVTVPELRQPLARLLHRFDPLLAVLSFTELEPDLAAVPGGLITVDLGGGTAR